MTSRIDWPKTFHNWTGSGGATLVTDPNEIEAFVRVINHWVDKELRIQFFGNTAHAVDSAEQVRRDGFVAFGNSLDSFAFLKECARQIVEHRTLWSTHLEQTRQKTIETGFTSKKSDELRYLKFQFAISGKKWFDPKTVKQLFIDYHLSTKKPPAKVIYL